MHLFLISPLLLKTRHKEAGILRCVLILLTHTSEQLQTKGGVKKKKKTTKKGKYLGSGKGGSHGK